MPVLRDVSFTLQPGELVVLLGANGAGKSTLLRCLAGWTAPTDGTIHFDPRTSTHPGALPVILAARRDSREVLVRSAAPWYQACC